MKVGYCPRWQGLRAEPGAARFMSAKRHAARPTDRALRAAGNHRRRRGVPPDDLGPVLYVPRRLASRFEFREHFGCPALNKLRDLVDVGILPDLAARHVDHRWKPFCRQISTFF